MIPLKQYQRAAVNRAIERSAGLTNPEPTIALPRLKVSYMDAKGPAEQSFDMSTHEGRKFHSRFVVWALKNNVTYTGTPAK